MEKRYLCPECRSDLKVRKSLIFSAKAKNGSSGLILFSPEFGNYDILHSHSLDFQKGDHIDFFCPVCHENLVVKDKKADLARVLMIDEVGEEFEVVFSEIAGKKAVLIIKDDTIVNATGKDAEQFMNYWGIEPTY